jgi:hypothetical protein
MVRIMPVDLHHLPGHYPVHVSRESSRFPRAAKTLAAPLGFKRNINVIGYLTESAGLSP